MKKLTVLLMVVCFLLIVGEAKALAPIVPVVIGAFAGGGVGSAAVAVSCGVPLGILGAMGAGLLIGEVIQFIEYPECRKEPTMGDLSQCVQSRSKKK